MRYFAGCWSPGTRTGDLHRPVDTMARFYSDRGIISRRENSDDEFALVVCRKSSGDRVGDGEGIARYENLILAGDLELYNRDEIHDWLIQGGHGPADTGDHDIAAAYLAKRGIGAVRDLIGDFALAVLDKTARRLSLLCDHMGLRSLYWCRHSDVVAFASTAAALRPLDERYQEPELRSLIWHAVNVCPAPDTSYLRGVKRIGAGSHVVFDTRLAHQRSRYWRPQSSQRSAITFNDAVESVWQEAERAIKSRIAGSPRAGLTVSGGLDSTLVANIASSRFPGTEFHALTATVIPSEEKIRDESAFAQKVVSAHENITHHQVSAAEVDLLAGMRQAPQIQAGPLRQILYFQKEGLYATAAGAGVTTIIGGNGGDAALSVWGNASYRGYLVSGRLGEAWCEARARFGTPFYAALMLLRALAGFAGLNRSLINRAAVARRHFRQLPVKRSVFDNTVFVNELFRTGVLPERSISSIGQEVIHNLELAALTGQYDVDLELPYRHGLEFRFPLLDWRLLECVLTLDAGCFSDRGENRRLMRALVSRSGSPEIAQRTSKGVFAPGFVHKYRASEPSVLRLLDGMGADAMWNEIYDPKELAKPVSAAVSHDRFDELIDRRIVPAQIASLLNSRHRE